MTFSQRLANTGQMVFMGMYKQHTRLYETGNMNICGMFCRLRWVILHSISRTPRVSHYSIKVSYIIFFLFRRLVLSNETICFVVLIQNQSKWDTNLVWIVPAVLRDTTASEQGHEPGLWTVRLTRLVNANVTRRMPPLPCLNNSGQTFYTYLLCHHSTSVVGLHSFFYQ
jgi:hypothetical protein